MHYISGVPGHRMLMMKVDMFSIYTIYQNLFMIVVQSKLLDVVDVDDNWKVKWCTNSKHVSRDLWSHRYKYPNCKTAKTTNNRAWTGLRWKPANVNTYQTHMDTLSTALHVHKTSWARDKVALSTAPYQGQYCPLCNQHHRLESAALTAT